MRKQSLDIHSSIDALRVSTVIKWYIDERVYMLTERTIMKRENTGRPFS